MNITKKLGKPSKFTSLLCNIRTMWFSGILAVRMVKTNNYRIIMVTLIISELQLALSILNENESQFSNTTNQTLKLFYCPPDDIIPFGIQLTLILIYWIFIFFLVFNHLKKNCNTFWLKLFAEAIYTHNCIFYYYINYILLIVIFQDETFLKVNLKQELRILITIISCFILLINMALAIITDRYYFQEVNSGPLSTYRSKKSIIIILLKIFYSFFIKTSISPWIIHIVIIITCILTIFLIIYRTAYYNMQILKLKLLMLAVLILITIHAIGNQCNYHINWLLITIIMSFACKGLFLMLDMNFMRLYRKKIAELDNPFDCIRQFYIIQSTLKRCLGLATYLSDRYEQEIYFKGTLSILHNDNHIEVLEMLTYPEKYAVWLLKEYVQKFPKSFSLRVLAINYFLKINEASQQIIYWVADIGNISNLDTFQQLELFKMKSMLKTHFVFNQNTEAIKIKEWIAYREAIATFRINLVMQAKEIKEFWTILQKNNITLNDLLTQSMKISNYEHLIQTQWENLSHFDHKKPAIIYALYSVYNLIALNSSKNARELLNFYKSFAKQDILNEMRMNSDNKNFLSLDVVYLIVSAQKNDTGKILRCSDNVQNILGYSQKELLNNDIQILIPEIYGANHYAYMRKSMELEDINIAHQAFDIFYINNKNKNNPCSLNIILDTHVEYGLCFLILLKKILHNGWYIILDDKGSIDSFSGGSVFDDNNLPMHINQVCPDFSKIQEAFNYMGANLPMIQGMITNSNSLSNDNLIPLYVEIYKKYTNGDTLDFRINKYKHHLYSPLLKEYDDSHNNMQSSIRQYDYLEKFWCVVKDNFIKQANNSLKIVRILHLVMVSHMEKDYLFYKKPTILKQLSIENYESIDDEIIETVKNFQGCDEDSKIGFAQIPLCSPECSRLIEIDFKDKKLLEINSKEMSGFFSNSSERNALSPNMEIYSFRKNILSPKDISKNTKNSKLTKFLQNSKRGYSTTRDVAHKLMPIHENSNHDGGIVDLETDGEPKLNSIDSKKRDLEIREAIQNKIIYNPSQKDSTLSTNISKFIRDLVSKDYTSKNINVIKYFLIIFFLLQLALAILIYTIQSGSMDQMRIDLIAIQYNTQRYEYIVEINRRVRAISLINDGYMSKSRHASEGISNYITRLQSVLYDLVISLKGVSDSLRDYASKYLSDISYDCLVKTVELNWYGTDLGITSQDVNIFDATNIIISESMKLAYTSDTTKDSKKQMNFLLGNTLSDIAIKLDNDSTTFGGAILKAILKISSVQYIISGISISTIIFGIIIVLTAQYKLKVKKEEILTLFTKLRDCEISILIKRTDVLINFLQLNNIHNNHIDKVLHELKIYEHDLDTNIEHKKISKTIITKTIHNHMYKQTFKIVFIFLIIILFYLVQMILFNNFTQLCTNESYMISKTYSALTNQGLAFSLIYQYVQTNGSSMVMNQNISDIIEEKIKITEHQLNFIASYYVDDTIANQANDILAGDLCANRAPKFCVTIGKGAGQRGLVGLNAWMYSILSTVYKNYINSNRSKEMAFSVLSEPGLIQLETAYGMYIRTAYTALSDLLIAYFDKNSKSMEMTLLNMTIGFSIILPIVFVGVILRAIYQINKTDIDARKMLRLIPDLLYVKNTNFKRHLIKEANLTGTLYNFQYLIE